MSVKQLSVFAENKNGSLYEITSSLAQGGINIRAFSVAETGSFGVFRMIVSDPRGAAMILSEEGRVVNVTDVVGAEIPDSAGGLSGLLRVLTENSVAVEYLYAFVAGVIGKAFVVLRVADNAAAEALLSSNGFAILTDDDLRL